jgi:hypothetical protein
MAISDSSLRNSIYTDIKSVLDAASLKYYNNKNQDVTGVTISAAYIDDNKTFPQVIINTANVAKDEFSFNRDNMTNTIQVMIDIYTKKKKNEDYITDQIDNISGLKKIQGLSLTNWDETTAFSPENENKIHLKSITLTYKRR